MGPWQRRSRAFYALSRTRSASTGASGENIGQHMHAPCTCFASRCQKVLCALAKHCCASCLHAWLTLSGRAGLYMARWPNAGQYMRRAAGWRFPARLTERSHSLAAQFNEYTARGKLHCGAGDYLLLAPLLAHAAETRLADGALQRQAASMVAKYETVLLTVRCKASSGEDLLALCGELRLALSRHLQRRGEAYGPTAFKPKHHYNMHTPSQAEADGAVYDMFLLERHHKRLKVLVENNCQLETFERASMRAATTAAHAELQRPAGTILGGFEADTQAVADAVVGQRLAARCGRSFAAGDLVQFGRSRQGDVGEVTACFLRGGRYQLRVNVFGKRSQTNLHARLFERPGFLKTWYADDCYSLAAWYRDSAADVVALF